MMQAIKRFDPDRGCRLSTYAVWWIRAAIQEYILRSWSQVRLGTTAAQKKLFFNLRRLKVRLQPGGGDLTLETVSTVAIRLGVPEADVITMDQRLSAPDSSLNAPLNIEGERERQDRLVDQEESQESKLGDREELGLHRKLLRDAIQSLNDRERHILTERYLRDRAVKLATLSAHFGVSRERIRQIEKRALEKLQNSMNRAAFEAKAAAPRFAA
jgi:RNA polymerase sigma-32 factor